ncbi:MAG TPA: hypothetical protein VKM54_29655 [Myxococcota bacterium]|nr:hypothetical protein [Myxococcota bacterium]
MIIGADDRPFVAESLARDMMQLKAARVAFSANAALGLVCPKPLNGFFSPRFGAETLSGFHVMYSFQTTIL